MKTLLPAIFVTMVLAACTSTINTTGEAKAKLQSHKTIAILPFEVRFDLRSKNQKQFSQKELAEVRQFMATGLQEHLYHWLISYSRKKPLSVGIQNIDITDSILSEKQIRFMDLYKMSRVELANILEVDAVLTPNVIFAQLHSEGASVAFMIGLGTMEGLATQEMRMQVSLNDNTSETPFWTFKTKTQSDGVTKPSKNKKKENILYPLFRNIDQSLIKFIKKFP